MSFIPEIKEVKYITMESIRKAIDDVEIFYILNENICESEDTIGVKYSNIMSIPNFIKSIKYTIKHNLNINKDDEEYEIKKRMRDIVSYLEQMDKDSVFIFVGIN